MGKKTNGIGTPSAAVFAVISLLIALNELIARKKQKIPHMTLIKISNLKLNSDGKKLVK